MFFRGVVVKSGGVLPILKLNQGKKVVQTMKEFKDIRQALEEHLSAINENTSEIQALFDYLQEMESKVDKFAQRLDHLQTGMGEPIPKHYVQPLNQVEKKVFLTLYTDESPLSYDEIASRARVPGSMVPDCVSALIQKNVPLLRSMVNNKMFFKLSPTFKELQAKDNIVNLSLQSFIE